MNATYQPHLYIDINNDGKYSSTTEDIKDIVVTVKGTGAEAEKNADGNYVLNKDVEYVLKRDVSNEYSGLLKWKLDVQSYQYQNRIRQKVIHWQLISQEKIRSVRYCS